MILGKPAFLCVGATISAGTAAVTMQAPSTDRFFLRMWRRNRITDQDSDWSTAATHILAQAEELAVRAAELANQFNRGVEFAALFQKEMHKELTPLRKINHKINIISVSSCIPTYQPSEDRFKQEITHTINSEEISARVYRPEEDTNAIVMFPELKRDGPKNTDSY